MDGTLAKENVPLADLAFDHGPILIGADADGGSPIAAFSGDLDEIRIYDRALTAADIAELAAMP